MRGLLILVGVILILVLAGWITFSSGPDRTSVNIEGQKIRQDTKQVMESGAKLLHRAGDKVESEAEKAPNTTATNPPSTPPQRAPITR
jgi:hypothetical protein